MSNDELYYDELTNLAERIASGLQNRTKPLDQLNQALNQLASTNSIKGKAADSMKAYIGEVHLTLIQTLSLALTNYQMVLGKYVNSYLEVDGNHNFKLVREDLEEHQKQLGDHRSDFTDLASQLKAISDKAEGIVYLGGAGSSYLKNVAQKMDDMKKIAKDLMEKWDKQEEKESGFDQVQDLLAQTRSLLKSTLKVPRGYDYKAGSFSGLMSKDFINALQTNASYAMDSKNQKEFKDDWTSINKDYTKDQERIKEAEKEKNRWNGLFTLVGAIVAGAALVAVEVFTAGLATPLVVAGGAFIVSDTIEGATQLADGSDYGLNPLRSVSEGVSEWATGSKQVGSNIYNAADLVVGLYSGTAEAKAFELARAGTTIVTASKASQTFDRVSTGYSVVGVIPINGRGDTVTSVVEDKVYQSSFNQWHNVAVSSILSHGMDITDFTRGVKGTFEDSAGISTQHMIDNITAENVQSVMDSFANQTNQRNNFARVVNQ